MQYHLVHSTIDEVTDTGYWLVVIQGIFDQIGEKLSELKPMRLYLRQSAQILLHQQGL